VANLVPDGKEKRGRLVDGVAKMSWNSAPIALRRLSGRSSHAVNNASGWVSFMPEKSSSANSPRAWK
jgi:hypothetical protein